VLHTLIALPEATRELPPSAVHLSEVEQLVSNQVGLFFSPKSDSSPDLPAALDWTADGGCPHVARGVREWQAYFDRLIQQGRATRAEHGGAIYWVAAERARTFSLLFPEARFGLSVAEIQTTLPSSDDALLALVTGWMSHLGPTTASQLGKLLGIPGPEIEKALLRMEASGAVLRGQFTGTAPRAGAPAPPGT
jgi:hypothetical protein